MHQRERARETFSATAFTFLIQKAQTNRVLDRADDDNASQLFGCKIKPIEKGMEACKIVYFIREDWQLGML